MLYLICRCLCIFICLYLIRLLIEDRKLVRGYPAGGVGGWDGRGKWSEGPVDEHAGLVNMAL